MRHVTLELIKQYLERAGWVKYEEVDEPQEQEGMIFTGWRSSPSSEGYVVCIVPMIEKKCLSFRTEQLIFLPVNEISVDVLINLLLAMLWINYRIILGKFSYEPINGEVKFSIDIPIDGDNFGYGQFLHSLGVFVSVVESYAPSLKLIGMGRMSAQEFMIRDLNGEWIVEGEGWSDSFRDLMNRLERGEGLN